MSVNTQLFGESASAFLMIYFRLIGADSRVNLVEKPIWSLLSSACARTTAATLFGAQVNTSDPLQPVLIRK